jgi:uncharacterized integral membrane protein
MTQGDASSGRGRRISPSLVVAAVVGFVLILFAVLNTDDVGVDFIADTVSAPLILVIFLSALFGFVIGWLVRRHRG